MEDRQNRANDDLLDRATDASAPVAVPGGPPPQAVRRVLDAGLEVHIVPLSARNVRAGIGRRLRRVVRIAVAASIIVALGVFVSWVVKEGSSNIAFANVAYVLEHLQSHVRHDHADERPG